MKMSNVRGFNYSGSWGTSGLDLWLHHRHATMAEEISRGKAYFAGWNTVRWWLSHEAFQRAPRRFMTNLDAGLGLFASHGIAVIPVLFNRWRDPVCDFGGVPLDHIVAGASGFCPDGSFQTLDAAPWSQKTASQLDHNSENVFRAYLDSVVGAHHDDERILCWDLCNEPLMGPYLDHPESSVRAAEMRWLTWIRDVCKTTGAKQPLTIGNFNSVAAVRLTEPLSDVISFHPYYIPNWGERTTHTKPLFEAFLDEIVDVARGVNKPMLASEAVWGSDDDDEHVAFIRYTLDELSRRDIGFIVHALHHSLVADLHSAAYGPVGRPGRLEFIEADGTLRRGHEAFNDYPAR